MMPYPPVDNRAPCRHGDADRFFPRSGSNDDTLASVKAECAACPFRDPCLAWALVHEKAGIWGGATAPERERMRRRLGIAVQAPDAWWDNYARCGTTSGYNAHRNRGEEPCQKCRHALALYQRFANKRRRFAAVGAS